MGGHSHAERIVLFEEDEKTILLCSIESMTPAKPMIEIVQRGQGVCPTAGGVSINKTDAN
ncbi:MAG TPA: hypothetical protein VMV39_00500 [Terracidiphilus sp.]|nr:hypothetical protein [Terracidiphilus sp.]